MRCWGRFPHSPLGGILAALLFRVTNAPEFVKNTGANEEVAAKQNNTVFADENEGPRVSNVLFAKLESKAGLGATKLTLTTDASALALTTDTSAQGAKQEVV